jgi:hypothetical protein
MVMWDDLAVWSRWPTVSPAQKLSIAGTRAYSAAPSSPGSETARDSSEPKLTMNSLCGRQSLLSYRPLRGAVSARTVVCRPCDR